MPSKLVMKNPRQHCGQNVALDSEKLFQISMFSLSLSLSPLPSSHIHLQGTVPNLICNGYELNTSFPFTWNYADCGTVCAHQETKTKQQKNGTLRDQNSNVQRLYHQPVTLVTLPPLSVVLLPRPFGYDPQNPAPGSHGEKSNPQIQRNPKRGKGKPRILWLVGGWTNPSEKYARQIGSSCQVGVKIKKSLKPPPRWCFCWIYWIHGSTVSTHYGKNDNHHANKSLGT